MTGEDVWRYLSRNREAPTFRVGGAEVSVMDVSDAPEAVWREARDEFLEEYYRDLWGSEGIPDGENKTRGILGQVRGQESAFCLIGIEHGNGAGPEPVANYTAFSPEPDTLQKLRYPSEVRSSLRELQDAGLEVGYDFHLVVHPERRGNGIGRFLAGIGQGFHDGRDVTVATVRYGEGDTPIYRLATEHFDYTDTGMWFDGGRTTVMYREHRPLDVDVEEKFPSMTSSESV